jgi:hypothetical protein
LITIFLQKACHPAKTVSGASAIGCANGCKLETVDVNPPGILQILLGQVAMRVVDLPACAWEEYMERKINDG